MFVKLPGSCRRKAASQRVSLRSQIRSKQSTSGERTRGQNKVEAVSDGGHEDGKRENPCPRLHSAVKLIGSGPRAFPTYLHKLALNQLWLPKFSFSSSTSTPPNLFRLPPPRQISCETQSRLLEAVQICASIRTPFTVAASGVCTSVRTL